MYNTETRFVNPALLASHFHIDPGSIVVDAGAGHGTFVPHVAKKVGPTGRLIACDVDRSSIDSIDRVARESGYTNVEPRWCDIEDYTATRIPDETADFALLINTLYQCEVRLAAIRELYRTMRTGGIVYVVDWRDSFGGIGPHPDFVIASEETIALFESSLFILEREYPAGAYHYGLAFRKV